MNDADKNAIVQLHLKLSFWHAQRANEAQLDVVHEHHVDLSQRLALEAARISNGAKHG